ncbi:TlpA family protein disulfide reductase [Polycladomyces subterraneus]|uniref:TlpA family protein disulfide reductase n=1 Tax=Polycladomyces subterraneus TaxID=1016997 RepID=A0ABT8IPM0_9BACL|nr:TlpA disulfide reductase family protein [Polycladomyces subterraneus]MDN4594727.1 TlpA family protein disulfide reductase [Polycladomyces subterraneus]
MTSRSAPDFCLPTIDGEKTVCLRQFRGHAVWLSFWVTWCGACQQDLPQKEVLYRFVRHPRFTFLSINVTGRESRPESVPAFLREHGYTFPVLKDDGRRVYDAFGITSVPATVLIAPDGTIAGVYDETVPMVEIMRELERILPKE